MKPVLKWTGGKTSELSIIKENMPENFDNFVEPFLGGGAVYFNLRNLFFSMEFSLYICYNPQ